MSDRSSKPSFTVSRNLKNAKYHFFEAKIDKLTECSDTTPNSVSTSTWLFATSNMKSTSHKTWQTPLLFLELLQIQNLKRKSEGTWHIISPPPEQVGGHVSCFPHQISPMPIRSFLPRARNEEAAIKSLSSLFGLFLDSVQGCVKWAGHTMVWNGRKKSVGIWNSSSTEWNGRFDV